MARKHERIQFNGDERAPVLCHTRDGQFPGTVNDISSSGVSIDTPRRLAVGQEVAMLIAFPEPMGCLKATAQIVRLHPSGFAARITMVFRR